VTLYLVLVLRVQKDLNVTAVTSYGLQTILGMLTKYNGSFLRRFVSRRDYNYETRSIYGSNASADLANRSMQKKLFFMGGVEKQKDSL